MFHGTGIFHSCQWVSCMWFTFWQGWVPLSCVLSYDVFRIIHANKGLSVSNMRNLFSVIPTEISTYPKISHQPIQSQNPFKERHLGKTQAYCPCEKCLKPSDIPERTSWLSTGVPILGHNVIRTKPIRDPDLSIIHPQWFWACLMYLLVISHIWVCQIFMQC